MSEIKRYGKWLLLYCALLGLNVVFCAELVPSVFPVSDLTSLTLIILSICLIMRYHFRLTGPVCLRGTIRLLLFMIFLLLFLRGVKYAVFGSELAWGRYTWYLYYLPLLCIPVLLFYTGLLVYAGDERAVLRRWCWVAAVTILLALFVLTNDLHQQVFRFRPGFESWDRDYTYGWGFIAVTAWQYLFFVAGVFLLIAKSAVTGTTRLSWLIIVSFAIGLTMIILLLVGRMPKINGMNIVQFPEAYCFMAVCTLECCVQLGLIPTNERYAGLIRITSLPVLVTDREGHVIYCSEASRELTAAQFTLPDNTRIGEHLLLRRMEIPGGYGFWQHDVEALDRLNEELEDARERLSQEAELNRLQNELKEKQKAVERRSQVYDEIAGQTLRPSQMITRIAQEAQHTDDPSLRDVARKHIALLGAYIKRCANMMLLSADARVISSGELGLSVTEVLRYLNLYGIPGELVNMANGSVPAGKALAAFDAFDTLIETYLPELQGLFVNMTTRRGTLVFRLTMEHVPEELPTGLCERLAEAGVETSFEYEDEIGYFSMILTEGGEGV